MKKLPLLLINLIYLSVYSQQISGIVYDGTTNVPLPGATVTVKNKLVGTNTDFDGLFALDGVDESDVLVFSSIGFQAKEIKIGNNNFFNVVLQEDISALDEVVVVGYGTQSIREITGSVSIISSEKIDAVKPTRIEQALQGQVSGVNITSQSGSPGGGLDIRIRGISTNGDNRPLILVDGNVIEELSVINPNDVASVSVLKDASAGIYGTRASNGVILITTKQGIKSTPLTIDYNAYFGVQETTRMLPTLNATEYALLANEAHASGGQDLPYSNISELGKGTNWQDAVFQKAPIYSQDFSLKGGGEKSTYSAGISTFEQQGIVGGEKASFKRLTARFNYGLEFFDKFNLKASILYSGTARRTLPENTIGSLLYNAINISPIIPLTENDGNPSRAIRMPIEVVNPLVQDKSSINETTADRLSGVFGVKYQPIENVSIESNYQWNYTEVTGKYFSPIVDYGVKGISDKVFDNLTVRVFDNPFDIYRDYTIDTFIKLNNTFFENHNFKLTLGNSIFRTYAEGYGSTGVGMPEINNIDQANIRDAEQVVPKFINVSNELFDSRLLSYFARLQYDYDQKYILSAVLRRDASSNFGPENSVGYFPSASFGWVISDEKFIQDSKIIDFLKLRLSYGILGNDRIGSFKYVSLLTGEGVYVFNNTLSYGVASGPVANPSIKWEQQEANNIGLDIRFLKHFDLTVDYFKRKTIDLLLTVKTSGLNGVSAPGAANPVANAGSIENSGIEFSLGFNKNFNDDFRLGFSINAATLENKVISVNNQLGYEIGGSFGIGGLEGPSRMEVGFPMGYFYGFKTDGIFQNQEEVDAHASYEKVGPSASIGDLKFLDINMDGLITEDDRTNLGNPIPKLTMGLNFSFDYKNFDFQSYFFSSLGFEIVRNYERNNPLTNRTSYTLNRWTGPGTSNSTPRVTTAPTSNTLFSDFYVEDGSFIRAQNIQLGYTFNQDNSNLDILKPWIKASAKSIRFYASINNLFTLTKYQGFDPTTSTGSPLGGGFDQGFYPNPRTFSMGVNVKF